MNNFQKHKMFIRLRITFYSEKIGIYNNGLVFDDRVFPIEIKYATKNVFFVDTILYVSSNDTQNYPEQKKNKNCIFLFQRWYNFLKLK